MYFKFNFVKNKGALKKFNLTNGCVIPHIKCNIQCYE